MYKFIIDTDQYAGNFERQLTAYCTGIVGDCHVGEEFLDEKISPGIFDNVLDLFENAVEMVPDEEYGYMRSTTIYPTPGYYNDGKGNHIKGEPPKGQEGYPAYQSVCIHFYDHPTDKMIKVILKRSKEFFKSVVKKIPHMKAHANTKIIGYRIMKTEDVEIWRSY